MLSSCPSFPLFLEGGWGGIPTVAAGKMFQGLHVTMLHLVQLFFCLPSSPWSPELLPDPLE